MQLVRLRSPDPYASIFYLDGYFQVKSTSYLGLSKSLGQVGKYEE